METIKPNFDKRDGLVIVVAQDYKTKEVLMVAYTDKAGYEETKRIGEAVYFSTSREKRWKKGEESGNIQKVKEILIDCDEDTLIYIVEQLGEGACHTGNRTCFYRKAS